jgi:hypothetical protein
MNRWTRWAGAGLALLLGVLALETAAFASAVTPEIDPVSIPAGLMLLAGGVLMYRARRGSK